MDLTEEYERLLLSQDQNLDQMAFQPVQYAQSRNLPVRPIPGGVSNTDMTVIGTASSSQTSSSNIFDSNCCSGCTHETVSQVGNVYPPELSAHVYESHEDVETHHTDPNDESCRYRTDIWPSSPVQPQMEKHASQMDVLPSTQQGFRESHWTESVEEPLEDFRFAFGFDGLDPLESNELCPHLLFQCNENQEPYGSSFQGGHRDSSQGDFTPHLSLLSEPGALRTVVPPEPSSSLRPTIPLVLYPDEGYGSVRRINAVAANAKLTGWAAESENTFDIQAAPMLNYHRRPSISILPPRSAELAQHVFNPVDQPAVSEVSSDISLESHQSVWDLTTGDLVSPKTRRPATDEERAHSQIIRNRGGQCERCKRGKRKVCFLLLFDYLASY